jgi:Fe-S-cluster containining protein
VTGRQCAFGSSEQVRKKILTESPRLGPGDVFQFACHPGVSCYIRCCADVNIFLLPYDVLRMKRRLGIDSGEFLRKYTLLPVHKEMKTPAVLLRMNDDQAKTCPFACKEGCSIYADRPWPCRMFPLGLAAQKNTPDGWQGDRFYYLLQEEVCQGFHEAREWTVVRWLEDQKVDEYDRWGDPYKELTLHEFFEKGGVLSPEKLHMLYMACYDLDAFRQFVFDSTLLERFDVDADFVEQMRYDDEELLRFSFLWLRFCLFGERTMKVKAGAVKTVKGNPA